VTDEVRDLAALYALEALTPEQRHGFEAHLAEGCASCEREVRAFREVAGFLGLAAPTARPDPSLRDRLLARLAREEGAAVVVPAGDDGWERGPRAGTGVKRLFSEVPGGVVTALLRIDPGARYSAGPARHEIYVLEGTLHLGGRVLETGDYAAAMAGDIAAGPDAGCRVLLSRVGQGAARRAGEAAPEMSPVIVTASEGTWRPAGPPGVSMRRLFKDPQAGTVTGLVQMAPGTALPAHRHVTAEQFYVIAGDAHLAGRVLGAGDYCRAPGGSAHGVTRTAGGCTFLLISSRLELLDTPA
jgi:quercetin dioxygenase-like cupin family protein